MKSGTPKHPKTYALAAALGVDLWGAVGILESLWHWTAEYAPKGDIGRYPDAAIAHGIGWTGDPAKLIGALIASGWLAECKQFGIAVHHWLDHCEQNTIRKLAYAGQWVPESRLPKGSQPFTGKELPCCTSSLLEKCKHSASDSLPRVRACPALPTSPALPCPASGEVSPEPPLRQSGNGKAKRTSGVGDQHAAAVVYELFPRKVGKAAALKAITAAAGRLRAAGASDPYATLRDRTMAYADSVYVKSAGTDRQYIPHPATWFNQGRYEDDPAEWEQPNPACPRAPNGAVDWSRVEGHDRTADVSTLEYDPHG